MPYHFTSHVIEKESTVKDIIIEILSEEFPLTIKKIYNIISKDYRKRVSYQAVYKAVHELLDERVLIKGKGGYSLNKDYIERLSYFSDRLKLNYKRDRGIFKELSEKKLVIKVLNSQYDMALFLIDIMKTARKGDVIAILLPVVWPGLKTPEIYQPLKEIGRKAEAYLVSSADGFLDKHFADYWRKIGVNVKLGAKIESMFDVFILRDLIIMIYQPSDVRVRKHKYTTLIKGLTTTDREKMFLKPIKEKTEIYAFIIKDSALANKMKQEIIGYF